LLLKNFPFLPIVGPKYPTPSAVDSPSIFYHTTARVSSKTPVRFCSGGGSFMLWRILRGGDIRWLAVQKEYREVEIAREGYPGDIGDLKKCGGAVEGVVPYYGRYDKREQKQQPYECDEECAEIEE